MRVHDIGDDAKRTRRLNVKYKKKKSAVLHEFFVESKRALYIIDEYKCQMSRYHGKKGSSGYQRVMLQHRFWRLSEQWSKGNVKHHGQVQGKTWFTSYPRILANAIGLKKIEDYSGHSVMATGASFMADACCSVE